MKRGRNQRRRPGANPNRALDSNGPEVRIRGTANQVYDKYIALARDATSAGDRIKAENYLQHAEHYFRVLRASQPPQQQQRQANGEGESDQEQPSVGDREDGKGANNRRNDQGRRSGQRDNADAAAKENADAPAEEAAEAPADSSAAETSSEAEPEKKPRRRRTRRPAKTAESSENVESSADDKAEAEAPAAAE